MHDHHSHDHHHYHHDRHHAPVNYGRAFGIGVGLNVAYIIVEAVFGVVAHSSALLADAGHNLSDVLGLLLSWGAFALSRTPASNRRTYGFRKATIMASFLNALLLMAAVGAIIVEAVRNIFTPQEVGGTTMMIVAGIGVLINGVTALLFAKGREKDINIRSAYLHMAADAAVSLGVVAAGLIIAYTGLVWIDPVVSLVIVAVIGAGSWSLLKESFFLSMDAVPSSVAYDAVREYLLSLDGVNGIHDLHIWAMSSTEIAMTAHLVLPEDRAVDADGLLESIAHAMKDRFGIGHTTIQTERTDSCCTHVTEHR